MYEFYEILTKVWTLACFIKIVQTNFLGSYCVSGFNMQKTQKCRRDHLMTETANTNEIFWLNSWLFVKQIPNARNVPFDQGEKGWGPLQGDTLDNQSENILCKILQWTWMFKTPHVKQDCFDTNHFRGHATPFDFHQMPHSDLDLSWKYFIHSPIRVWALRNPWFCSKQKGLVLFAFVS